MSNETKPCCTAAHNLEVVRRDYDYLTMKHAALEKEAEQLRRFQWVVLAMMPTLLVPKERR
jgi:hypothetical protein